MWWALKLRQEDTRIVNNCSCKWEHLKFICTTIKLAFGINMSAKVIYITFYVLKMLQIELLWTDTLKYNYKYNYITQNRLLCCCTHKIMEFHIWLSCFLRIRFLFHSGIVSGALSSATFFCFSNSSFRFHSGTAAHLASSSCLAASLAYRRRCHG